jgi:predicted nucleic acid-binding protein
MDPLLCSVVTVAELWAEARPAEHDALNQLFDSLITVPVRSSAQATAAKLWTRNRKNYPMKNISFF